MNNEKHMKFSYTGPNGKVEFQLSEREIRIIADRLWEYRFEGISIRETTAKERDRLVDLDLIWKEYDGWVATNRGARVCEEAEKKGIIKSFN